MFAAAARLSLISLLVALCSMSLAGKRKPKRRRPKLQPIPKLIPAPKDNPTTPTKVALGKQLFFDNRLSGNNTISCSTCHLPQRSFADGLKVSRGINNQLLTRNTPSVLNAGLMSNFFWDGRTNSLEAQALAPIQATNEMHQDLDLLVKELASIGGYARQFRQVFDRPVNRRDIGRALAAFQRSLVTRRSPFDRYLAGDKTALSASAKQGLELFKGDAGCIRCHHGPLLSDGQFYRLGVGRGDKGRGAITKKRGDLYKFRTPSLRNVAQTAPYMHDGSQRTLYDVVQFYYRGIPSRSPDGLKLDVEPLLGQSFSEIDAIVAFLKSLSSPPLKVTPPKLP